MAALYDSIGLGYAATRAPDGRVAAAVAAALGDAARVVNVGAGAGSYEPVGRRVVAVEPSIEMIRQRADGSAVVVRARAERLPFQTRAFDAALAILTIHHWSDRAAGLGEMRRVARRVVILTWDPEAGDGFWLTTDYLPEIRDMDVRRFPARHELEAVLGPLEVRALPVPHDCGDGFLGAFWRRPERYLDASVRRAMSGFAQLHPPLVARAMARLHADLRSGAWSERWGRLRTLGALDLGYRIVIAGA